MHKRLITLLGCAVLLSSVLTGCEEARIEREKLETNAVKSVQESESVVPGVPCIKFMGLAVKNLESNNHYVKIKGWMAYKEPGHEVVVFQLEDNEKPLEFKWHIENGMVIPVNELAQGAMTRQKAKYM